MDEKTRSVEELERQLEELRKKISELESGGPERKMIDDVLNRFCESTYSTIFNAASDAIFISEIEHARIIDANDKACEMYCYPKEEILKLTIYDLGIQQDPFTRQEADRLMKRALDGEPQLFEWVCKDKAGRPFWVEVNLRRAIVGGKYHILSVVRDISERKKLEDSLTRINETFLAFGPNPAENINHLTGLCGELLSADCALYNRLEDGTLSTCGQWKVPEGFNPKSDAEGHICYDLISRGENGVTVIQNLPETKYAKTDPNISAFGLRTYLGCAVKFGEHYVGSLCVLYQYDFQPEEDDKKIMEIIASAIGVEEERRSAEDISHLARFSIDHASDAIFWLDKEGHILYVNDMTCKYLGYTQDELLSMKACDIDPRYSPESAWRERWENVKNKKSYTIETLHKKKDGTFLPVELSVNYLEYENNEYCFAAARDISKRKKQEEALLRRDYQLEILSRTSLHVNAVLEIPVIMRTLVTAAMELVDASGGTAGLLEDGKMKFTEYAREGKLEQINYTFDRGPVLPGWVIDTLKPYISNDAERDSHVSQELQKTFGLYNLVNVPILSRKGELLGCFEIHNKNGHAPFDVEDVFMLQGLAASAAIALENAKTLVERNKAEAERIKLNRELVKSNARMKKLALKDTLTGLYNHQYLNEVIEAEFYRARRYGHSLSVIMLDIDYFKSINDVYGHDFGDIVLKQFATYVKKMVRKYDTVIRFGGEEFVIISPAVDMSKAQLMAQRILDAVGLYNFGNREHIVKLKLSVAVAAYPNGSIARGMELINAADKILSKVKEAGGNRVFSAYSLSAKKNIVPPDLEPTDVRYLKEKIEKLNRSGKQSLVEFIFAFAKTIELKDHYTGEHVENTVRYSTDLARRLHLSPEEVENIREASVLHDLGKIGISDKILLKKAKLTKKEFDVIKHHPQIAADIIRPIQFMHDIIPLILYHHERWDGKGYPAGLKGEEIPVGARIIAVADVYQALTSNRPYRKAFPKKEALKIIKKGAGTQFDPTIVNIFLHMINKDKEKK
ncbi:MAG: diguanylate cyclase [Candidatus Omnitrophica bacterium]|nr:diguanylate cyclase [Candidatus Omnitrophota bacterium]